MAGLKTIPAIVRDYDEHKLFEVALIENLQREDLNPIEEAQGYKSLIDKFSMTQEMISSRVGKSRSAVTNALRVLTLPPAVVSKIEEGALSTGHAKVLLSLPSPYLQTKAADVIILKRLSVRETEKYIKTLTQHKKDKKPKDELDIYIQSLENDITRMLSAKVKIKHTGKRGKIEIEYCDNDDFERIIELLKTRQ